MLVEDNVDDERLMVRAFGLNGQNTSLLVARDGEEAIGMLHGDDLTNGATKLRPALILLDLKLPRMSGIEVLKKIRSTQATAKIPVVILTMSDEGRDVIEAYRAGANSYVRKSIDFDQFIDSIRQIENYWLNINSVPYP